MPVHIETAEVDEMREVPGADDPGQTTLERVTHELSKRSLPATLNLKLAVRFHTEPEADVSIATEILSHTGESVFSREDSTQVPPSGKAHITIDMPVTLTEPGHYTIHCDRWHAVVTGRHDRAWVAHWMSEACELSNLLFRLVRGGQSDDHQH